MFTSMNPLSRETALLEILIMLVGSFAFGYFVRWYGSCCCGCECTCDSEQKPSAPAPSPKPQPVAHAEKPAPAPVVTAPAPGIKRDDLKKIEGIGPAIEKLLNTEGILTFTQVAEATPVRLRAILEKAGPQFALHECESWPQQAALARDGKWVEFEALLAKLLSGQRV